MPRAVPPWLHRVCIREYGPDDPWMKLLLFTINSTMDAAGESFHGQASIAKSASMGVSTVRAKIDKASRQGWIAIYARHQQGQKWKSYLYRACVPDHIDLSQITCENTDGERLADAHQAIHGDIPDDAVKGTLYPQKGKKRAPPAAGGSSDASNVKAPPADDMKHRQRTEEAPPANDEKHRQPLRAKSSSEVLRLSSQGEGALKRTASFPEGEKKTESSNSKPELQASTLLQKVVQGEQISDDRVLSITRKLIALGTPDAEIHRVTQRFNRPGQVQRAIETLRQELK